SRHDSRTTTRRAIQWFSGGYLRAAVDLAPAVHADKLSSASSAPASCVVNTTSPAWTTVTAPRCSGATTTSAIRHGGADAPSGVSHAAGLSGAVTRIAFMSVSSPVPRAFSTDSLRTQYR